MATLKDLVEQQEETNLRLDEIDDRFRTFFSMLRADKLDMLEMMREIKSATTIPPAAALAPGATGGSASIPTPTFGGLGKFAIGGLVLGPALMMGFVEGAFQALRRALKIFKVDTLLEPITRRFRELFGKNSKIFSALDDLILKTYVLYDDYLVKPLSSAGVFLKQKFTSIRNFFDPNGIIGRIFSPITDGLKAVGGVFSKIGATFAKVFGAIRAFGAVVGRLFVPIGIILSIVDTVKGAISAFTEEEGSTFDKLIAGAFGGLEGLINGLIMMPLDLLKDGVSWISDKLGFDNFSEMLDSFSFQDLFSNMIDGITDVVQKIFNFPIAVGAGGAAALGAILPGGESPVEAFNRVFTQTMESGATAGAPTITAPPSAAEARTGQMERSVIEQAASMGGITVINNTNAPTSVSSQSSTIDMGSSLPSPTQSNGTRADAYAGA